jgi:hypothetical protein
LHHLSTDQNDKHIFGSKNRDFKKLEICKKNTFFFRIEQNFRHFYFDFENFLLNFLDFSAQLTI